MKDEIESSSDQVDSKAGEIDGTNTEHATDTVSANEQVGERQMIRDRQRVLGELLNRPIGRWWPACAMTS